MIPIRQKFVTLILLATLIASAGTVRATDLRGGVEGPSPATRTIGPLAGITVALFVEEGGKFVVKRQVVTGPDGTYYIVGVDPGDYILQIAGVNYPLKVNKDQKQDIPVIRLQSPPK